MKTDFVSLYHAATDASVDWPEDVKRWAELRPANAHILRNIRALLPGHPANAQTVTALVKEVLAEMDRVPEKPASETRDKALSGRQLPDDLNKPGTAKAQAEAFHPSYLDLPSEQVGKPEPYKPHIDEPEKLAAPLAGKVEAGSKPKDKP